MATITVEELLCAAEAFLEPIQESFWEEHGIGFDEVCIGLMAVFRGMGYHLDRDVHHWELDEWDGRYYTGGWCMHAVLPTGRHGSYRLHELEWGPLPPLEDRVCPACREHYERVVIPRRHITVTIDA